jgi:NDP-sugar pyrophosphorylase family protein
MKALVLAAGRGERLRPLTDNIPKPMVTVAGRPVLEYNIHLLAAHDVREIAINLHHRPEVTQRHFGDGSRFGVRIRYSYEPDLLGTAGAVRKLAGFLDETFFVVYGDNLTTIDLTRLMQRHRSRQAAAVTMALYYRENPEASGIVGLDAEDRILRFLEKPCREEVFSHWVNAGVLVVDPAIISRIPADRPSDFGRDILPALIADGLACYGYRMTDPEKLWWIDSPEDLQRTEELLSQAGIRLPSGAESLP